MSLRSSRIDRRFLPAIRYAEHELGGAEQDHAVMTLKRIISRGNPKRRSTRGRSIQPKDGQHGYKGAQARRTNETITHDAIRGQYTKLGDRIGITLSMSPSAQLTKTPKQKSTSSTALPRQCGYTPSNKGDANAGGNKGVNK